MHKIAITSNGPLSGKSTLAKHLESEYGFTRADHSRSLVQDFVENWNNPLPYNARITVEQVYTDKESWRPLLQQFGHSAGYNIGVGARDFIAKTIKRSEWAGGDLVYEPFRGEEQANVLRSMGFTLVQLDIDMAERMYRAMMAGVNFGKLLEAMVAHPELELGICNPDITLNGAFPVDKLARILLHKVNNGQ